MRNLKRTLATSLALSMVVQLSAPALAHSTNPAPVEDNSISALEQEVRVLSTALEETSVAVAADSAVIEDEIGSTTEGIQTYSWWDNLVDGLEDYYEDNKEDIDGALGDLGDSLGQGDDNESADNSWDDFLSGLLEDDTVSDLLGQLEEAVDSATQEVIKDSLVEAIGAALESAGLVIDEETLAEILDKIIAANTEDYYEELKAQLEELNAEILSVVESLTQELPNLDTTALLGNLEKLTDQLSTLATSLEKIDITGLVFTDLDTSLESLNSLVEALSDTFSTDDITALSNTLTALSGNLDTLVEDVVEILEELRQDEVVGEHLCGEDCSCSDDGDWEPLTSSSLTTLTTGNYYLSADLTMNLVIGNEETTIAEETEEKTINLCLNGKTLTSGEDGGSVITVLEGWTLNLYDCDNAENVTYGYWKDEVYKLVDSEPSEERVDYDTLTGGIITGGTESGIVNSGTLNMYGGNIVGNSSTENGGGVYNDSATQMFTMNGGTIQGNKANSGGGVYNSGIFTINDGIIQNNMASSDGGGVYNASLLITNGGTIQENSATKGGGVYNEKTFNLLGGTIIGNEATGNGGGVLSTKDASDIKSSFEMSGGVIESNNANNGGGVYLGKADFTMHGGSIVDNFATINGGGVMISQNGTFTLKSGTISTNTSDSNGEGICQAGKFTLGEVTPTRTSTSTTITITDNDVYLTYDTEEDESRLITIGENFTVNRNIPVSMEKAGVFTTGADATEEDSTKFISADTKYIVTIDNTKEYSLTRFISKIEVNPDTSVKNEYKVGDYFDPEGLEIIVTYSDDSTEVVTYEKNESDFSFSSDESNALNTTDEEIIITYGDKTVAFEIRVTEKTATSLTVTIKNENNQTPEFFVYGETIYVYTSIVISPSPLSVGGNVTLSLFDTDKNVILDTDDEFTKMNAALSYDTNKDALSLGKNTLIVAYSGDDLRAGSTQEVTVTLKKELVHENIQINAIPEQTYTGSALTPDVTVTDGETTLTTGTDYTVEFTNSDSGTVTEITEVGTYTVTITGIGNYTGTAEKTFSITEKSLTDSMISDIVSCEYTGSTITPDVIVEDGDTTLTTGTDYTVEFTNSDSGIVTEITEVGTYTVTITGKGNYDGTATAEFEITAKDFSTSATFEQIADQTHTGQAITPEVVVKDGGTTLVKDTDYAVSYSNNTNVGTATVTITGKGNYKGTASTTFEIKEAPVTDAVEPTFSTNLSTAEVKYTTGDTAAALTVTASASDSGTLSYQWYSTTTGVVNTSSDSKVGTDLASYTPPTTTEGTIYYYVVVTNTLNSTTATATSQLAKITVEAATSPDVSVTDITLDKTSLDLEVGETDNLTATVKPTTATNQAVTWSSSYEAVATVDSTGNVTAVGAGTATITVTTTDGKLTATCTVTVTESTATPPEDPEEPENTYSITLDINDGTGGTTTLETNIDGKLEDLEVPTRSGYTFDGWFTSSTGGTEITTSTVFDTDTTIYAQWTKDTSGDSSEDNTGGTTTTPNNSSSNSNSGYVSYSLTYPTIKSGSEGTASVSPSRIESGKTGTVTVTPKDGYVVDTITIVDAKNNSVDVREADDGTYQFTQPVSKVTVRISYVLESEKEETLPDGNTGTSPEISPETAPNVDNTDPTTAFLDINDTTWCYHGAKFVLEQGYMSGTSSTTFSPDGDMTRAMLVTVLHSMEGKPTVTQSSKYVDVSSTDYYYQASLWATDKGIVSGTDENLFSPNMSITREQVCLILYKYAMTQANIDTSRAAETIYPDGADISPWAQEAVNWCASKNMLTLRADGNLQAKSQATRGEIATMLLQMYLFNS